MVPGPRWDVRITPHRYSICCFIPLNAHSSRERASHNMGARNHDPDYPHGWQGFKPEPLCSECWQEAGARSKAGTEVENSDRGLGCPKWFVNCLVKCQLAGF